jgi:hypothetical protein
MVTRDRTYGGSQSATPVIESSRKAKRRSADKNKPLGCTTTGQTSASIPSTGRMPAITQWAYITISSWIFTHTHYFRTLQAIRQSLYGDRTYSHTLNRSRSLDSRLALPTSGSFCSSSAIGG